MSTIDEVEEAAKNTMKKFREVYVRGQEPVRLLPYVSEVLGEDGEEKQLPRGPRHLVHDRISYRREQIAGFEQAEEDREYRPLGFIFGGGWLEERPLPTRASKRKDRKELRETKSINREIHAISLKSDLSTIVTGILFYESPRTINCSKRASGPSFHQESGGGG